MKILFITLYPIEIVSSAMIANINLIDGFIKNNCEVTILSPSNYLNSFNFNSNFFSHRRLIRFGNDNSLFDFNKKSKESKSISKVAFKLLRFFYKKFSIFDSSSLHLRNNSNSHLEGIKNEVFDLVITTSDPISSHYYFLKIRRNVNYKKWIQLWGDPLTEDITKSLLIPKILLKFVEFSILNKSDYVNYVSFGTFKRQKLLFPSIQNKFIFNPIPFIESKITELERAFPIKVSYVGNLFSRYRNANYLINAISNNLRFELHIFGSSDIKLEKNHSNVFVVNKQVSPDETRNIEEKSEILVVLSNRFGYQVPAKVNYLSATNKTILIILENEKQDYIKDYYSKFNRFHFCYNTYSEIEKFLMDYYLNRLNSQIKNVPVKKLSSKTIAANIIEAASSE